MKIFRFTAIFLISASVLLFSACEKENNDPVKLDPITVIVDATSYSEWVYFSFSAGDVVTVADPGTSADWDIALKRNHFKTNSGTSGNGAAGALDAGEIDFESYNKAPEDGYTVDSSIDVFSFATMTYSPEPGNTVLETWGTFTDDTPPTLVLSNKVFAVKTADGKYAKMIVQSYVGTGGTGFITFTYAYQPDGSTNL